MHANSQRPAFFTIRALITVGVEWPGNAHAPAAGVLIILALMREFSSIGPRCSVVQTVSTFLSVLFRSGWLLIPSVHHCLLPSWLSTTVSARLSPLSSGWHDILLPRGPLPACSAKKQMQLDETLIKYLCLSLSDRYGGDWWGSGSKRPLSII